MALDYNILNKQNSLLDAQKLQQSFELQKATQAQALQTSGIDAATKGQNYQTQLLSAAAASNDPNVIAQAKSHLNAIGQDTSAWSDDPAQLAQQTAIARQFLINPYQQATLAQGAANVGLKAQEVGGNTAAAIAQAIPGALPQAAASPSPSPSSPAPVATPALVQQPDNQGSVVIPPKPIINPAPQQVAAIDAPAPVVNISADPTAKTPVFAGLPAIPPQQPNETNAQYNARVSATQKAQEMDPNYIQAKAKAEAAGKVQSDVANNALQSDQNYQKVSQTLDAIKQMAPTLPQQENFVGPDTRAALNQNLGDGKMAADYSKFKTINEAQTLGAIQTLADTGQIRMTRTLENIINRGFLVDPNLNAQGKIDQANAIQAELRNAAVAPANVNAQINGGQIQPYSSPLQQPAATVNAVNPNVAPSLQAAFVAKKNNLPLATTQADFNALPAGAQYVEPDGNIYTKPAVGAQ